MPASECLHASHTGTAHTQVKTHWRLKNDKKLSSYDGRSEKLTMSRSGSYSCRARQAFGSGKNKETELKVK